MKKVLITLCLGGLFLTSCGGGNDMKADAKKMAEFTCKIQKDPTKAAELTKEMTDLSLENAKKYNTPEDMKAFAEALAEEMKNCK